MLLLRPQLDYLKKMNESVVIIYKTFSFKNLLRLFTFLQRFDYVILCCCSFATIIFFQMETNIFEEKKMINFQSLYPMNILSIGTFEAKFWMEDVLLCIINKCFTFAFESHLTELYLQMFHRRSIELLLSSSFRFIQLLTLWGFRTEKHFDINYRFLEQIFKKRSFQIVVSVIHTKIVFGQIQHSLIINNFFFFVQIMIWV